MKETAKKTSADPLQDEKIVSSVLSGNHRSFELIMRKYNARLYRVGMAIINNETEVEDIMQTAYIKAYQNLSQFSGKSSFCTWLTRILINESLLQLKKKQRYQCMEDLEKTTGPGQEDNTGNVPTPIAILINKELGHVLESALVQIPEKYRLVFVLREMEGLNIAETIDILGITEANVKVRLNRAKGMLRDSLSSYYKNDTIFHFHLSKFDLIVNRVLNFIEKQRLVN
jgi:RNA polymerase sigma factor (sigma-70 family)